MPVDHARLGASTSPDADVGPTLLVPVGSCEQHGPHLPLDTDTRIAEALALAAAARCGGAVLVTPAIGIGASGEHQGFAGTLSIGVEVLTAVLVEVGRSADWAAGVVFVNGHGGNTAAVRTAVATLVGEGRHVSHWWPSVSGGDAHAGRTETSIMLAIAPEVVRPERAAVGATAPLAELIGSLRQDGVRAVSPNGVLGDPTGATAEDGHAIVAELVDALTAHVTAHRGFTITPGSGERAQT